MNILGERVCVCHHTLILWNEPSLVFIDTSWTVKETARLIGKGILHSTDLGINFLAMQMQCGP